MSPVDFKKWQCPLSLFFKFPCRFLNSPLFPVDFKKGQCPLSLFFYLFLSTLKRVQCRLSNLRKGCVALSNLRVKGHNSPCSFDPGVSNMVKLNYRFLWKAPNISEA